MIAIDPLAEAQPEITPGFCEYGTDDLLNFDPENDPDCLVGARWLCRKMCCLWIGPAGVGKSSLRMQFAINWGLGNPMFGMKPVRPMRSLVVQGENVLGDEAEMFQGVIGGMGLQDRIPEIRQQLSVIHCNTLTSNKFVDALELEIQKRRPDMVWIDPLLSFVGEDISGIIAAQHFLRQALDPMLHRTGVCLHLCHHTGKPPKDSPRRSAISSDNMYAGFGSSDLPNWCRAVNILIPEPEDVFRLLMEKRGTRTGAVDLEGQETKNIFLKHSDSGICWEQCAQPENERKANEPKVEIAELARELKTRGGKLTNQNKAEVAKALGVSERTAWTYWGKLKAVREAENA